MRIAFFTDTYHPTINGVVSVIDLLTDELSRLGHQVYIVAPRIHGEKNTQTVFRIPSLPFPGNREHRMSALFSTIVTPKLMRSLKIDVIYTHTPFNIGILGARIGHRAGIPIIHFYQTHLEEYLHYVNIPPRFRFFSAKKYLQWYCAQCDGIVVPTRPFREKLHEYGIGRHIDVVPTGIKVSAFRNGASMRTQFAIPETARVLLSAGRLQKEKNFPFLIDMFSTIGKKHPDTYLLIAGDGKLRSKLTRQAKATGIGERIIFAGYIDYRDMHNFYATGDIFVFASKTETQGLVLLEAMAAGLPVIAVAEGGVPDVIDHGTGGWLTTDSLEMFTDQVDTLLAADNLKYHKRKALQHARTFDARICTKRLVKVLERFHF